MPPSSRRTLPQCFAGNAAGDYNVLAGKASLTDKIGGSERKEVPCTDKIDSYRGFCKTDYDDTREEKQMNKMGESAENYLETILILLERKGNVRAIDIANELDFSKPSVSVALKHLREQGHVFVSDDGLLSLTESGKRIAETIYERHQVLTGFFISLGVPEKIAQADACKIEHIISPRTFEAIKQSLKK